MDTRQKWYELFESMFDRCLQDEKGASWALALKLGEELGELQEEVLKDYGYLKHKETKEGVWLEVADLINVLVGFLATHYPNMTAHDLTEKLYESVAIKFDKYERILRESVKERQEDLERVLAQGFIEGSGIE